MPKGCSGFTSHLNAFSESGDDDKCGLWVHLCCALWISTEQVLTKHCSSPRAGIIGVTLLQSVLATVLSIEAPWGYFHHWFSLLPAIWGKIFRDRIHSPALFNRNEATLWIKSIGYSILIPILLNRRLMCRFTLCSFKLFGHYNG